MFFRNLAGATVLVAACAVVTESHAQDKHGHEGDFEVGKDASNQLIIEADLDEPFGLPPVDGPLLFGCAFDDPGFLAAEEDEPEEGLFMLPAGASVVFELVAIDPGLVIYSPGFTDTLDMPGNQFTLGNGFDSHPTYHVDSTDPAWDPEGIYSFTFRLLDENGLCDPSIDYTVMVQCAEPGGCCLPDGECEDGEFEGVCEEEGGEFLGEGSVCATDSCALGACCFPGGNCEEEIAPHCEEEGGQFAGPGTDCASACDSVSVPPVPTVTTWGMIVMCMLLGLGVVLKVKTNRAGA